MSSSNLDEWKKKVVKEMVMEWNYKQIRKRSWDTTFKKGRKSWLTLVMAAFLFAFIGVSNGSQTTFIDAIDECIWANNPLLPGNVDILKEYIAQAPIVKKMPFITSDLAVAVIDSASRGATWILRLLAANLAYFQRNKGEVVAILLIGAVIDIVVNFFILNVMVVGRNRFVMENRFSKEISMKRIVAPFHKDTIWNTVKVMFLYKVIMLFWWFTIIGGIYKSYQYSAVPYLLAENPNITWKEAKNLSKRMTNGYKWKMFLTGLPFMHIWCLKIIPLAGLLVSVPLEMTLDAEVYFTLRNNADTRNPLLTETAFFAPPYIETAGEPEYVLKDLSFTRSNVLNKKNRYSITNLIILFFLFSLLGWLWECGLHIFRDHELVNRGTLYGPWIPIYGVGGTTIVFLLDRFKANKIKLIAMEIAVCAVLEYLTSFILDFMFNSSYWDYKTEILNVNGRICFAGLTAFAIGGMAAIYLIAPMIASVTGKYSKKRQLLISGLLCMAFVADILCCLIFGFNTGAGVGGTI